uniref:Uncharacterized protein n=1 Tax=Oryza meridionalis TaxID=40149 RepID=A0A0E0F5A4_9ORYZ
MDDSPLCYSQCSQSKGCKGAVVVVAVHRVAVAEEGVVDQGARGQARDKDGDTIAAVIEEDDVKSNHEGRDVTLGLPDQGMTRDERVQRCCQYRAGEVGDHHESSPMSEETSKEGLRDSRGARTAQRENCQSSTQLLEKSEV